MRYLTKQEIITNLNLGKTVEVFLGRSQNDSEVLNWLEIEFKRGQNYVLTFCEVYDEGSLQQLDIYSFPFVDSDEDSQTFQFDNIDETIKFIKDTYKLKSPNFVNQRQASFEYEKLLRDEE